MNQGEGREQRKERAFDLYFIFTWFFRFSFFFLSHRDLILFKDDTEEEKVTLDELRHGDVKPPASSNTNPKERVRAPEPSIVIKTKWDKPAKEKEGASDTAKKEEQPMEGVTVGDADGAAVVASVSAAVTEEVPEVKKQKTNGAEPVELP